MDLNKHLSKEDIERANKHIKICSTLFGVINFRKKNLKAVGIKWRFGEGKEGKGVKLGTNGEEHFSEVDVMASNKRK